MKKLQIILAIGVLYLAIALVVGPAKSCKNNEIKYNNTLSAFTQECSKLAERADEKIHQIITRIKGQDKAL